MERRLYEAAITGNTSLLQEDPDVLARASGDCSGKNNPLHIGALFGHVDFVKEILRIKPEFASDLNSQGQSPLHLASGKGHVDVVKELLNVNSDICFVHDRDGRTPLHVAAVKGRLEVLEQLYNSVPEGSSILTDQREPILHLCVKHNQFDAMKKLIELERDKGFVERDKGLVNMKDDDDNTILHLLAAREQYEVIKYLITEKIGVDVNAINVNGWTAFDLSGNIPTGFNRWKIRGILKNVGASTGRKLSPSKLRKRALEVHREEDQMWSSKMKEALLVVATLMASITFQAGMNPPGGVFQEDKDGHKAGTAIMSYLNGYKYFTFFNITGLFASLSLILLLVSGLSFTRKISIQGLIIITWIAVASILGSYVCSFTVLTPSTVIEERRFRLVVPLSIALWLMLMCIVLGVCIFPWLPLFPYWLFPYWLGMIHFCQTVMQSIIDKVRSLMNRSTAHAQHQLP